MSWTLVHKPFQTRPPFYPLSVNSAFCFIARHCRWRSANGVSECRVWRNSTKLCQVCISMHFWSGHLSMPSVVKSIQYEARAIAEEADKLLFKKVMSANHCIHFLLSSVKYSGYCLRAKGHSYELPRCEYESHKSLLFLDVCVTNLSLVGSKVIDIRMTRERRGQVPPLRRTGVRALNFQN